MDVVHLMRLIGVLLFSARLVRLVGRSVGMHCLSNPLERERVRRVRERRKERAGQKVKCNASVSLLPPLLPPFFRHFSYLNSTARSSTSFLARPFVPFFLSCLFFFFVFLNPQHLLLLTTSCDLQRFTSTNYPNMKITFGYIVALIYAHQLLLSTTTTIPLACASPLPQPINPAQAAQAAAIAAAAEAARRAAEMSGGGFSGGYGEPSVTPIATPGAGTATPEPAKEPVPQPPATGGASGNSLTSGGNWATNKMKMRKRAGLSGDDYISSHSLSMQTLEDTTGNNSPSVKSVPSPSSERSPFLERRRGILYERRGEFKEEVVSPKSPEEM